PPHRRRGRRLLRALRLPRRRPAAPLAGAAGAGTGGRRGPPRRGLPAGLRRDPEVLGREPRQEPGASDPTRRPGTDPRLAVVLARGEERVREGVHEHLSGALREVVAGGPGKLAPGRPGVSEA